MIDNVIFCHCGCGQLLKQYDNRGRERKYILGHYSHVINLGTKRHPAWNKNLKGIHLSPKSEFKKGMIPWNKGLKGFLAGNKHYLFGKKFPDSAKEKVSGENNYNWKGGVTPIYKKIRKSTEYKLWREAVFKRDNWTCVFCGKRGGILHPDHIKPFAYFPELRFAIDNGRTLCIDCHKKTDTWGRKI